MDSVFDYMNQSFIYPLYENKVPEEYKCSHCGSGRLHFEENSFCKAELKDSIASYEYPDWEPEWVELVFSGILTCKNCNEKYTVSGIGALEQDYDHETDSSPNYTPFYTPKYFNPPLDIFNIPKNTPSELKKFIKSAFSLAWADFPAAGNRLRAALEIIVDDLIQETKPKRSLGNKINNIPDDNSDIRELMNAIKWLGNDASHEAKLTECDLAFAFNATELILKKQYPDTDADKKTTILAHAKEINKVEGSFITK